MTRPVFFIDVNIPMYAAGTDHPLKPACVWVMQEIAEGRLDAAIDVEIIQEILHRYGAIGQPGIGVAMATNLLDLVPTVFPVMVADVRRAVDLFEKHVHLGVTARGVLHAAVMHDNGLSFIISTDQHFDRMEGVMRIGVETLEQLRASLEEIFKQ